MLAIPRVHAGRGLYAYASSYKFQATHRWARFGFPTVFGLLLLYFTLCSAPAQIINVTNTTSTPVEGVGHDYIHMLSETVNPANGSVSVRINVPMPSGRGITVPFNFAYDSNGIYHVESSVSGIGVWMQGAPYTDGPLNGSGGWGYTIPTLTTSPSSDPQEVKGEIRECLITTGYVLADPNGGRHAFGMDSINSTLGCSDGIGSTGGDSQFYATFDCGNNCTNINPPVTVSDAEGTIYHFASTAPSNAVTPDYIEDRNGNILHYSLGTNSLTATDTLGRNVLQWVSTMPAREYQNVTAYTDTINVGGLVYTVSWIPTVANYSVPSNQVNIAPAYVNCTFPTNVGSTLAVISTIGLPNGQSYHFYYGDNNPDSTYNNPYGLISEIDYPGGASVKYTWKLSDQWSDIAGFAGSIETPDGNGNYYQTYVNDGCQYQMKSPVVATRTVTYTQGSSPALQQVFSSYNTTWAGGDPYLWSTKATMVSTTDLVTSKTALTNYTYTPVDAIQAPYTYGATGLQFPVESEIQYFDWGTSASSTPLMTVYKTWDGYSSPNLVSSITQYGSSLSSQTVNTYQYPQVPGQIARLSEQDEYAYNNPSIHSNCLSPAAGCMSYPLYRKTIYNYKSFPSSQGAPAAGSNSGTLGSIFDRPCKMIVYDSDGNRTAETDSYYDGETTPCGSAVTPTVSAVTGLPAGVHDETNFAAGSTVPRANLTKTVSWLNSGNSPTKSFTYDETGQILSMTDPCGNTLCSDMAGSSHTTLYSYIDNFTGGSGTPPGGTNAYLTQVTMPSTNGVAHVMKYGYRFADGQLVTVTDQNNQTTTYSYNDPLARLTMTQGPPDPNNGGQQSTTSIAYNDAAPSPSVTTSVLMNTAGTAKTTVSVMDGIGQVVHTQLTSDPAGADLVDTTYDGIGNIASTSNPYRPGDSIAITRFSYDALKRKTYQLEADGVSAEQWCYNNLSSGSTNCSPNLSTQIGSWVDYSDEHGSHWQRISDAFGRLLSVIEPAPATGLPTLETDYSYDTLNNLQRVHQTGASGETARPDRTFAYDSLGRLLLSSNPETGQICYGQWSGGSVGAGFCQGGYDANGNVQSKIDARGTGTQYSYDVLNRLLGKSYSDGTPSAEFDYDQNSGWNGLPRTNTVGRLWHVAVGAFTTGWYERQYSYDAMGRVNELLDATPSEAGSTNHITDFKYDLAGNTTDIFYPRNPGVSQPHVQQTWDAAGHLTKAFAMNGATETDYLQSASYYPSGQASSVTYGNGVAEYIGINNRLQTTSVSATNLLSPMTNPSVPSLTGFGLMSRMYSYTPASTASGCGGNGNNGNVWQITDTLNPSLWNRTLTYDCLNRLTSSQIGTTLTNYSIDSFGNMSPLSGTTPLSTFDPTTNRINNLPCAASLPAYDSAGNQTCDTDQNGASRSYAFDAEERSTGITVQNASSPFASYVYSPEGDRIRKSLAEGTWTEYQWSNGKVLSEKDQNNNWTDYIYANGSRIAANHSTDVALHIHATATANDAALNYFLLNAGDYNIKNGDKLSWREYQSGVGDGGLEQIWFWYSCCGLAHGDDETGQWVAEASQSNVWQQRTLDLSPNAGGEIQTFSVGMQAVNGTGDFDVWFADMAIYSSDGTVIPVFTRSQPATPYLYDAIDVTNYSATTDTTTVPASTGSQSVTTTYFVRDPLGTTQLELSSGGWPTFSGQFTPYGQDLSSQTYNNTYGPFVDNQVASDNYKFTGKERDPESGNDYFGARYYSSSVGRFLSADKPFADQHTSNPQSWNLYEYGRNNPLKNVDINGFKVLPAVLAEAVSKINSLPGGTLYLDFAGIQGPHSHQSLGSWANFDSWHSDHSSDNSVIIPNNGIVSGFFRALFGLANKDQVDTGKAIVAAAKAAGQDVAFDTYSNGVNAAGKVAQVMSAGDLRSGTVVGPNANSSAPVQAIDQADGNTTQIYISINDPALALALFGSQSADDWTADFGNRVHVTDQSSHDLNQYRDAQDSAPLQSFCPAEFASCN